MSDIYMDRIAQLEALLASSGLSHLKPSAEDIEILIAIMKGVKERSLHANMRGAAGTGKSVMLTFIVLLMGIEKRTTCVAAPTHKACSVLRLKFEELEKTVNMKLPVPCTLHSLLNLKPKHAEYGQPEVYVQRQQPYFPEVDLMLIDECSMLGADLMGYINKDIVDQGIPTLFSGDPYQLRPVGETKLSSSFKTGHTFKLLSVRRHSGPVLELATHIRNGGSLVGVQTATSDSSSVTALKAIDELEQLWLGFVQEDSDNTVMVCYKNETRRRLNKKARVALHGENVPRFMEDDVLLSLKPIDVDDEMVYPNNADITVVEAELLDAYRPISHLDLNYRAWRLLTGDGYIIYVLADHEEELKLAKDVGALGKAISKQKDALGRDAHWSAVREVKARWSTEYFPLKKAFADVDFRFAMTIHKSQGSTYKNVFVHTDYREARQDIPQLLYVAATRASENLHVVRV